MTALTELGPADVTDDQLASVVAAAFGVDRVELLSRRVDPVEYDLEALGESTFAAGLGLKDVPEEATNPASCGVVVGAGTEQPPRGGVATEGPPASRGAVTVLTVTGVLLLLLALATSGWRHRPRPPEG